MGPGQAGSMRYRSWKFVGPLLVLLLIPLLAFTQEPPPAEKQPPKDQAPNPRLDLYGDPLPEGAVARMGTVRFRHGSEIYSLAVSPDGSIVASAGHFNLPGEETSIILWDATTGKRLLALKGHTGRAVGFHRLLP